MLFLFIHDLFEAHVVAAAAAVELYGKGAQRVWVVLSRLAALHYKAV
jgi:hypothetical protein